MSNDDGSDQDKDSIPLTELHLGLERCLLKLNGKVKHCGRNAFSHLRCAWTIREIDPEMSAFRAITAEEEAASALLLSIQQKKYPGSDRLNHRDHVQKIALTPFFKAVSKTLERIDFAKLTIRLNESATPPTVNILIDMNSVGLKTREPLVGIPDQPLNFSIATGPTNRTAHRFEDELKQIAQGHDVEGIIALIKREANIRNRLLYAGDTGIPRIEFKDGFLIERLRRVTVLLVLTIAIQQTSMHQLFALQCLRSFLLALQKIDAADFGFEHPQHADGFLVEISKMGAQAPSARVGWQATIPITYSYGYYIPEHSHPQSKDVKAPAEHVKTDDVK